MQVFFGSKVLCQNGRTAGSVVRVIMDEDSREVTHIVVGKSDLLARDCLVPLNMVESADEKQIVLYVNDAQVKQLASQGPFLWSEPSTTQARPPEVARTKEASPPTLDAMVLRQVSLPLGKDTPVNAIDGRLGVLAGVRLDLYTNKLASIVVPKDRHARLRLDIPARWISHIDRQAIRLATNLEGLKQLVGPEAGPYLAVEEEGPGEKEAAK